MITITLLTDSPAAMSSSMPQSIFCSRSRPARYGGSSPGPGLNGFDWLIVIYLNIRQVPPNPYYNP